LASLSAQLGCGEADAPSGEANHGGADPDGGAEVGEDAASDGDAAQDIKEDPSQDVAEDDPMDGGEDVAQDVGEDVGEDVAQDVTEDVGEDVAQDVAEDVGQDVGEDVGQDVAADVSEDVAQDVDEDAPLGEGFEGAVLPAFERGGCLACHGPGLQLGGLRLDTVEATLSTGEHAPVVVPCSPGSSDLLKKLRVSSLPYGDLMPLGGPEISDADYGVISDWIEDGAGLEGACDDIEEPEPEEPTPLLEERRFRVSARVQAWSERVSLAEQGLGASPLFTVQGEPTLGYVAASGRVLRVPRRGDAEVIAPSWDADATLGEVYAVELTPSGVRLASTEVGLLYEADGAWWPSPVSSLLEAAATEVLAEDVLDPRGREGVWFGTQEGLYSLVGGSLDRVWPAGVSSRAAVGGMAIGRAPGLSEEDALWVVYGAGLYALRPDLAGDRSYRLELNFGAPLIGVSASGGVVWTATERAVFQRRPGALLGRARWIKWTLPEGQRARALATTDEGAVWLLTDQALYRSDDQETWTLAQGAPASDVVGLGVGDQGSAWLTRPGELVWASLRPTVGVSGLKPNDALTFLPPLELFPTPSAGVLGVSAQVDDCPAVEVMGPSYTIDIQPAAWDGCLGAGQHTLMVTARYEGGAQGVVEVPFAWEARDEVITWHGHIEPMVYGRHCARVGCHVGGFEPDDYEGWVERVDAILDRTDPGTTVGRMPPNGARLTEVERLLIRWWREDGFQP
jgi:hypothetical protein